MMKLVVFALENIGNFGDNILSETTDKLLHEAREDVSVVHKDLCPDLTNAKHSLLVRMGLIFCRGIRALKLVLPQKYVYAVKNSSYCVQDFCLRHGFGKYYKESLKDVDAVVFAIGMLKFATQDFSYAFEMITHEAEMRKIPVLISASSIARPIVNDWRYRQLVTAVNRKCVRLVTTRDGTQGVCRFNEYYKKRTDLKCEAVGDPALWCPEVYKVTKVRDKRKIGINVPRYNIYRDYDGGMDNSSLMRFYVELLQGLLRRNADFALFYNGLDADFKFAKDLLSRVPEVGECLMNKAENTRMFVEQVAGFSAVFGARLHACLVAHSLGIPMMGLMWDDKLRFFANSMGVDCYFLEVSELEGDAIAERLVRIQAGNFDYKIRDELKSKTLMTIKTFLTYG